MLIRHRNDSPEFQASDGSWLREWLHPERGAPNDLPFSVALARVEPGERTLRHVLRQTEVYLLLRGRGRVHIDGEARAVGAGDAVVIPPGAPQFIENTGGEPLEFLAIVCPPWCAQDDHTLDEPGPGG